MRGKSSGFRSVRRHVEREKRLSAFLKPLLVTLLCLWNLPLYAGSPATVTFSLNFPNSDPERYSISVDSNGHAHYECTAKISADSDDREDYQSAFNFSDATRARIFNLAEQAHFFSGKIDAGKKKLAFTGEKKLTYKDDQKSFSAEYNYSSQPAVQDLTTLFQSTAATLEFGRHLTYYHRYQKLGLDDELKQMEDEYRHGDLMEIQAIRPVLQQIYDDPAVMNVVRARAQRLMEMGKVPIAGR
jgi:hypothetical protein